VTGRADGDGVLAVAGELRDVLAHPVVDVDEAAFVEEMSHRGGECLGG
jgi:hypothetical protein